MEFFEKLRSRRKNRARIFSLSMIPQGIFRFSRLDRRWRRILGILIGCAFLSLGVSSAGPVLPCQEKQAKRPLQYEVSVTLKLIQVYVTDKSGKPVTDLTPADFELSDNGKRQTITEFEKHLLTLPEGRVEVPAAMPSSSKMNRKFFFFFDFVFNNMRGLERAKKAALHFIETELHPDDEVGVLSYSIYKGLTLHEYLTTSHQKVREVIEGFGSKDVLGRANNVEVEYWGALQSVTGDISVSNPSVPSPAAGRDGFTPDKLKLQDATIDRMIYQLHARNFTSKLRDLAAGLRYVPGNKYLILFSSGIASSIFQGAPVVMDKGKIEAAIPGSRGATMYNVDSLEAAAWEEKKYENMAKELAEANTMVFSLNTENMGETSQANKAMLGDYALKKISKISGGEYFSNIDNYEKNLSEIQNLTSSYYVLGYYIEDRWDGKYHKIKVTAKRPGCEVHAQGGYFNPKPFNKYTDLEKTLNLIDLALSDNPLIQEPAHFPVISFSCPDKSENLLLLVSDLPVQEFSGRTSDQVEAITLVFDRQKNIADFKRAVVNLSGPDRKKICHYTLSILPPGEYECRIVLRNLKTGQAALAKCAATIRAPADPSFLLFPPLLLDADSNTYFLGVSKTRRLEAGGSPSSLMSVYPFAFDTYAPLTGPLGAGTQVISALVRYSAALGLEPELKLTGVLKNQTSGQENLLPASVRSGGEFQTDDKTIKSVVFLIEFQLPPQTGPGAYTLKIAAEENKTQLKTEFSRDIYID
jgi:VWFA-related protein